MTSDQDYNDTNFAKHIHAPRGKNKSSNKPKFILNNLSRQYPLGTITTILTVCLPKTNLPSTECFLANCRNP